MWDTVWRKRLEPGGGGHMRGCKMGDGWGREAAGPQMKNTVAKWEKAQRGWWKKPEGSRGERRWERRGRDDGGTADKQEGAEWELGTVWAEAAPRWEASWEDDLHLTPLQPPRESEREEPDDPADWLAAPWRAARHRRRLAAFPATKPGAAAGSSTATITIQTLTPAQTRKSHVLRWTSTESKHRFRLESSLPVAARS